MENTNLCLTIHDYIDLPDGSRRPYCAIPSQSNFAVQRAVDRLRQGTADILATLSHVNNENENVRQTSNQRRAQSLPPGKEFHVFFSHSSEDRQWVIEMVNKLESPEFGFRCCFADRDFDIGVPVFENVIKYINLSKKTVIVLTPHFLQSPWCSYETRITMEMDLGTKQRLLVPIMLRNCRVPDFIGRLSYIEVDNEHFWDRFLQAIHNEPCEMFIEPVRCDEMIPGGPLWFNPNFKSTDVICDVVIEIGPHGFSGSDAYVMPNELKRNGMQLTTEDYRAILGILSGNTNLLHRGTCAAACYWITLAIFVCIAISIGVVAFTLSRSFIPLAMFLPFATFSLVMGCVWRCRVINVSTQTLRKTTAQANKIAIRHNMMVSCKSKYKCSSNKDSRNSIGIVFMYYEWRPCHSYLKEILQNDNEENGRRRRLRWENMMSDVRTGNIETRVENLLMHHATKYGQLVLEGRAQYPTEQRHARQKECLCQFIERVLTQSHF